MKKSTLIVPALALLVASAMADKPSSVIDVTIGKVDQPTARLNRRRIEAGILTGKKLPNGLIQVDQAIRLKSNSVLEGSGATVIEQPFTPSPYPENCIVCGRPERPPIDYLNKASFRGTTAIVEDPSRFRTGGYCWSHHRGVYDGQPQNCRLHRVIRVTGKSIELDSPPADNAQYLNGAIDGRQCSLARGLTMIDLSTKGWRVGQHVFCTDGMVNGDEPHGEIRRIVKLADNQAVLDQPLTMGFDSDRIGIVCPIEPIVNVNVRNVTLRVGNPESGLSATFFSFTRDIVCNNVTTTQGFGCTCSSRFAAVNCTGLECAFNNSSNCEVSGGNFKALWVESGCEKVDFHDITVCDVPNDKNVLGGGTGSGFCSMRRVRIERAGQNLINWNGPSLSLADITVVNSYRPNHAFITSDGLRIERCTSDGGWVCDGRDQQLIDLRGADVTLGKSSEASGIAINVSRVADMKGNWSRVELPAQKKR